MKGGLPSTATPRYKRSSLMDGSDGGKPAAIDSTAALKWKVLADREKGGGVEVSLAERVIQEEIQQWKRSQRGYHGGVRREKQAKQFEEEKAQVQRLEQGLEKSRELTNKVVAMLHCAEKRLSGMEDMVEDVHRFTGDLARKDKNLQKTISLMEQYLNYFQTAGRCRSVVQSGPRRERYLPHLEAVQQIDDALKFFDSNKDFKGASNSTDLLNQHLSKLLMDLNTLVIKLVSTQSSPKDDCRRMYEDAPEDAAGLVTPADVVVLKDIAAVLFAHQSPPPFVQKYKEARFQFLAQAFRSIADAANVPRTEKRSGRLAATSILADHRSKKGKGATSVMLYKKGSHSFLDVIDVFLKALKLERNLAVVLIDRVYFDQVYQSTAQGALSLFLEMGSSVMKTPGSKAADGSSGETIFATFDMLESLERRLPAFEEQLKSVNGEVPQSAVHTLLADAAAFVQKWFVEFPRAVSQDSAKSAPVDATVHEHTANTLSYLKNLFEYREIVEKMLPAVTWRSQEEEITEARAADLNRSDDQALPPIRTYTPTALGNFVRQVLSSLEGNIIAKSKTYKQPAFKHLFLLNNYHYMVEAIVSSEDEVRAVLDPAELTRLSDCVTYQREQFQRVSWDVLLPLLLEVNAQRKDGKDPNKLSNPERNKVKNRFSGFNSAFKEVETQQRKLYIPDPVLRASVRQESCNRVLPLYTEFVKRYENSNFTRHMEKYLLYRPETLARQISTFYGGDSL